MRRVADKTVEILGQPDNLGVVATFVSGDEIRLLNKQYRDTDRATDVLSFPAIDNVGHGVINTADYPLETDERTGVMNLGDIVICMDIAKKQAEEYGHGLKRECCFLFAHGLLHLLGYDHIDPDDEREMTAAAEKILSACKIER